MGELHILKAVPWELQSLTVSRIQSQSQSQSHFRYLFLYESYCPVYMGRPLWREDGSVICPGQSVVMSFVGIYTRFTSKTNQITYVQHAQGLCQSRLGIAEYALLLAVPHSPA
jgi:hypothetical protein